MCWYDIANFVVGLVSSIATLVATAVALYLALRDSRQRVDCVFMWETATGNMPMIILNNIGNRTVIVERVDLFFDGHKIWSIDILGSSIHSENAIISPNKETRITLKPKEIEEDHVKGMPVKNPDTKYKLTAVVTTTNNRKYKSSYMYSYSDLQMFMFLCAFNSN